ncbi:hypothetical protein ABZS66_43725 [Dactylosporangium sp. NPDC005572]|uniref:hypothetical protein n=1 Tax=Dactylosporangium sp. NPDC005572 TaxID=3156889 RepID=UPI0033B77FDF
MTGWRRALVWVSVVVGGLVLVGLGTLFVVLGLARADQLASVIGAFVGLTGLPVAVYGVVLARRALPSQDGAPLAAGAGTAPPAAGGVHHQVRAGRDAYTAGRDQHFGEGGPKR